MKFLADMGYDKKIITKNPVYQYSRHWYMCRKIIKVKESANKINENNIVIILLLLLSYYKCSGPLIW